ncbi:MAG TPA: helix-turn-helix transcriptional regulator [Candidatus Acidoferrum sp.]|nr:helix-turn-helix transcriptional regulator [Candidatus Acidoferrum sp.]
MGTSIQITAPVLKVLSTFLSDPKAELSGAEISKRTGLKSGTLYPILIRLESSKWLDSEWEAGDPKELGRPRRRFYRITGLGARNARQEIKDFKAVLGRDAWATS